jgi:hypothetical protein
MRLRFSLGVLVVCTLAPAAPAAIVVVANLTANEVTFTVAEPGGKPQQLKLAPLQTAPVRVTGPADLTFAVKTGNATFRIDPYNAYVFIHDPAAGRWLEGVELPGNPPERDARPELNPPPPEPVKIPVTLLVDDADPRAEKGWQEAVRKRFDEAAAAIEAHSGVRLEFAGFGTWRSDPRAADLHALLAGFEAAVKVKPGQLAVGFTSRRVEEKDKEEVAFGACKGVGSSHVLVREWRPRSEPERVEVLVHYLGTALGAVPSPDPLSVMRPKLGDGLALDARYRVRFDPLNALAMCIWADELRGGPLPRIGDISEPSRVRLTRVYKALLKARPGDSLSLTYLNEFDAAVARVEPPKAEEPKKPREPVAVAPPRPKDEPLAKKDPPPVRPADAARAAAARQVVRAVIAFARSNTGPTPLTGDDLTAAYVRVAAEAALKAEPEQRVPAFLLGLGVALDDTPALRTDPATAEVVLAVESDAEREERLAALGNPTLRHRRDLSRRFAAGCVTGELLTQTAAENSAVGRSIADLNGPAGLSFAALAADLAGVEFGRRLRDDPELLNRVRVRFAAAEFVPATDGLRDGLSAERFAEDYGSGTDDRFRAILAEIRQRVRKLPAAGK